MFKLILLTLGAAAAAAAAAKYTESQKPVVATAKPAEPAFAENSSYEPKAEEYGMDYLCV